MARAVESKTASSQRVWSCSEAGIGFLYLYLYIAWLESFQRENCPLLCLIFKHFIYEAVWMCSVEQRCCFFIYLKKNIVPWKLDELRMFMKENTFVSLILIYMVSVGCVGPERSHQTRYSFIYTWLICFFEEVFVVCRIIYDNPLLSPRIISAFYRLRTFS